MKYIRLGFFWLPVLLYSFCSFVTVFLQINHDDDDDENGLIRSIRVYYPHSHVVRQRVNGIQQTREKELAVKYRQATT